MIDSLVITSYNVAGGSFDCYQDPMKFAVTHFDWSYPTAGEGLAKFQAGGKWDNNSYVDSMPINLEGDIVGFDSNDYVAQRKLFLAAVVPSLTTQAGIRNHSRVVVKFAGDANSYYADVQLKTFAAPLEAMYPSVSSVQIGWECNYGYWRNLGSGAAVLL
jgi:hypothetical protein